MAKIPLFTFLFVLIFCAFACSQEYNSVLITEIMADPSPVIGLPDVEYLEIYNRSGKTISLKGWKLLTGTRSSILPDSMINPGSYVVICHKNNVAAMSGFGPVIGINSLSLTNDGMLLALYNKQNQLIYSISYLNKWWSAEGNDGGFSLEMIDANNPCGEAENWLVSTDKRGGTPAQKNSIATSNPDIVPPLADRVDINESGELVIVFNEKIDSLNAVSGAVIELSGHKIIKKRLESPAFYNLIITPDPPLLSGQEYELSIRNISDCAGNLLREFNQVVALPSQSDSGDVVINEILFNPRTNGVDFVELYNRSKKYISLKNWSIGNTKNNEPNVFSAISANNVIMPPNSYLALTTDPSIIKDEYPAASIQNLLKMTSFPAYSNTEGGVMLRNGENKEYDKFIYNEKMHHELLSDFEGISLEKIDVAKSSMDASNWQSAAATVGYATPGYANSQTKPEKPDDAFSIEPEAFTPDNDGQDDYAIITYKQSLTGQIATIRIYNVSGILVKNLLRNQLIGTSGDIRWDGTNERGQPAGTGYYFILIDIFDTAGNTQQYKKKVMLARRNG